MHIVSLENIATQYNNFPINAMGCYWINFMAAFLNECVHLQANNITEDFSVGIAQTVNPYKQ